MTAADCAAFYQTRIAELTTARDTKKQRINSISNLRLVTAFVFLLVLYFAITASSLLYLLALVLLAVFVGLVKHHSRLFAEHVHLENLLALNQHEAKGLKGDYSGFSSGIEFIDPHHPYSHDLDLFGEASLYQAINRCNTLHGKRQMAERLQQPLATAADIEMYQHAAKELAGKTLFRQHVQAAGKEIEEQPHDYNELLAWLKHPNILFGKAYMPVLLVVLPLLTVGSVGLAFFFASFKSIAVLLALAQWFILGTFAKRIHVFHEYISRKKNILEKYAHLLYYLEQETFTTPLLQTRASQAREADTKVKSLAGLVSALNARLNAMTTLVTNSLLLYDMQCVYRLEKWKHDHASNLPQWLEAVRETEVLCSLGTFAFNNPHFTYPTIHAALSLDAKGLGHPLIPSVECVANDVTLGNGPRVLIITGANMAGKSTFLRTIGVNLVLALSGAPVCAQQFACPIISLRSGMRTADSLKDHQSYFYAELNRLQSIMNELRQDKPLFILLDEILKGTNSTDKQAGSIALVRQLLPHPCLGMIATHDLALGALEQEYPTQVKNYCFEATIKDDQLSFDYTLKPGLAQTMNATFLMKKMGIIPPA